MKASMKFGVLIIIEITDMLFYNLNMKSFVSLDVCQLFAGSEIRICALVRAIAKKAPWLFRKCYG